MITQNRKLDFKGQKIFVGLDVHRKSWRVSIHLEQMHQKTIYLSPPGVEALVRYLEHHYPNASYECAYEAGFCGFWLQKGLEKRGIPTLVAHAADVPTTDKERQQKDDIRDSRKLARSLSNGDLDGIYIPGDKALKDRSLVRYRWSLAKDRKQVMNQIKSYLHFYGLHPPQGVMAVWSWDRSFMSWLQQQGRQEQTLGLLLRELESLRTLEKEVLKQIRIVFKGEGYAPLMRILTTVPGIGFLSAVQFVSEIVDMRRFRTFDQLCFFVGLVPATDSSGDYTRATQRTSRGNKRLRTMLIECAWVAIRHDNELALAFSNLKNEWMLPTLLLK